MSEKNMKNLQLPSHLHRMRLWFWTLQRNGNGIIMMWIGTDGWQLNIQAPFHCNYTTFNSSWWSDNLYYLPLRDREISAPATLSPEESHGRLSSSFNSPPGLGEAPRFLETQAAEALIRMKYSMMPHDPSDGAGDNCATGIDLSESLQSPMVLDLPGPLFSSSSTSCPAVPEICTLDNQTSVDWLSTNHFLCQKPHERESLEYQESIRSKQY